MFENIFYASFLLVFYAYAGYPLSLYVFSLLKRNTKIEGNHQPSVSIVIAAYNEEKSIGDKIENTLAVEYPREKLQIIIASDGSTDGTDEIVAGYQDKGIELLAIPDRRGKENAQKEAVRHAIGDILVFTDVATTLEPSGVKQIVSNFSDPGIGCVSSEDRVIGKGGEQSGEGFYVRYEMWVRRLESKVNSLVGLSGSFFAARKEVCEDFSEDLDSDFRTLLNSIKVGLRGISDPMAIGYYRDISDPKGEFERKIRTVQRGLTVFFKNTEFLNISKYGLFSYQYFCHKLLRWLVPFLLAVAFLSNLFLVFSSATFFFLYVGQIAFYSLGFVGWHMGQPASGILLKVPMYFISVNYSICIAWVRFIRGERIVTWTPTAR